MVARQETRKAQTTCRATTFSELQLQDFLQNLSTLSLTEYILRTIDCEFAFDKCNNFCEKDTLETLVTETSAFKEKDVEKTTSLR